MALGLHCPLCGSTDPMDWNESAGNPTTCRECSTEPLIVDGCDVACDHAWDAIANHPDLDDIDNSTRQIAALFPDEVQS